MGHRKQEQTSWNNCFFKQRSKGSRDIQTVVNQKCRNSVFEMSNGDRNDIYDARSTQTSYSTESCLTAFSYISHRFTISTVGLSRAERRTNGNTPGHLSVVRTILISKSYDGSKNDTARLNILTVRLEWLVQKQWGAICRRAWRVHNLHKWSIDQYAKRYS